MNVTRLIRRIGDERLPICDNCTKRGRQCRHLANPMHTLQWVSERPDDPSASMSPASLRIPRLVEELGRAEHLAVRDEEDWVSDMSTLGPRDCLKHITVAELFHKYVVDLAPWYDLNDPQFLFTNSVSWKSLDHPVLFKAIIAFAASHSHRTSSNSKVKIGLEATLALHSACLRDLIQALQQSHTIDRGEYLASACLLRSYEILNGDTKTHQEHLFGAFALAVSAKLDLHSWGLVQAGFWNYLREDITVALECERPLHIQVESDTPHKMTGMEQDYSNSISYILAKAINAHFSNHDETSRDESQYLTSVLRNELEAWKSSLPSSFNPFSTAPQMGNAFPSIWLLRPWHIAAHQYASVTEILLLLLESASSELLCFFCCISWLRRFLRALQQHYGSQAKQANRALY